MIALEWSRADIDELVLCAKRGDEWEEIGAQWGVGEGTVRRKWYTVALPEERAERNQVLKERLRLRYQLAAAAEKLSIWPLETMPAEVRFPDDDRAGTPDYGRLLRPETWVPYRAPLG